MPRTYSGQGIVLKRDNFSEADRLVTIFSQRQGKLKLLAKGVRRLTSRKKGHLELFTQVKFLAAKGKSLDLITEVETLNNFKNLRQNLNRVRVAYLLCELTDQLTAEGQEHPEVYRLLLESLAKLNSASAPKNLIEQFEAKLLTYLGFGLPPAPSRASLEAHIASITYKMVLVLPED